MPPTDQTEPVTLPKPSSEAACAYHEGYAIGIAEGRLRELEAVVAWLLRAPESKAWRQDPMEATAAALLRGEHLVTPAPDPTADKAQLATLAGRR